MLTRVLLMKNEKQESRAEIASPQGSSMSRSGRTPAAFDYNCISIQEYVSIIDFLIWFHKTKKVLNFIDRKSE